ncbi:PRTRC system protein B [Pedobacter miscanthi]|uniref:PRTRC system protein B n=1 Tax=Pedobacter miscanthi TaxID=2259170 RepID=A0A366LE22_9SPHI|nr:PRTRC system protein B [Pedobacter miscanthi]RBQ12020.1 PRTRC system protein B [Pedobacter miscanthi]
MKNITNKFSKTYLPAKALLLYREQEIEEFYIESYDIGKSGKPTNAHPLSVRESQSLADILSTSVENRQGFLQPKGLLPQEVVYINSGRNGFAIWFTPEMKRHLIFKAGLTIPDGVASMPPLLWKATASALEMWALKESKRPELSSILYYAPFFNVYRDGRVCMGSVDVDIDTDCYLETFILTWENYFFGSAFSHLLGEVSPVKVNVVSLWQKLISSDEAFPINILKKHPKTIKDLLS